MKSLFKPLRNLVKKLFGWVLFWRRPKNEHTFSDDDCLPTKETFAFNQGYREALLNAKYWSQDRIAEELEGIKWWFESYPRAKKD